MSIQLTGIPSNYATPGDFLELNLGVGPAGIGTGEYAALLIANKTAAGKGTVDTYVYGPNTDPPAQSETDVIDLAGAGSEAHRLWRRFRMTNKTTPLYLIFPDDAGGSPGTTTIVLAVVPTSAAVLRCVIGDEVIDTSIAKTQSIASIGAAAIAQINNRTWLPVIASFAVDTFTFTSKNTGPRANQIRVRMTVIGSATAATTVATPNNVPTALTGGTGEDDWSDVLSTIVSARYYYIVSPSTNITSENFDDLTEQVAAQALPLTGIRQRVIAGFVGSQASGSTIAANVAVNSARVQIVWLQNSDWTAGELAAHTAACLATEEDRLWSYNFRDYGNGIIAGQDTSAVWRVPAPFSKISWPSATGIETALNSGLMPIRVSAADGGTSIVWSITTKHKSGTAYDFRARSSHIVSVLDRWCDEFLAEYSRRYGGKNFASDPRDGEAAPAPNVVTPRQIRSLVTEKVFKYANKYLKDAQTIANDSIVERDAMVSSRIGIRIPLRAIDLLLQSMIAIDDNSSATP